MKVCMIKYKNPSSFKPLNTQLLVILQTSFQETDGTIYISIIITVGP